MSTPANRNAESRWTARTARRGGRSRCRGSGRRSPCSPAASGSGPCGQFEEVCGAAAGDLRRELADDDAALDDDRDRRQGHADGGDAARGVRVGLVADQPVVRVGLVQVVQHRGPLEPAQLLVGRQPVQVVVGRQWLFGHRSPHLRQPSATRTSCVRPSSRSGTAPPGTGCSSTVTDRTPRPVPAGLSTRTRYVADRWR